VFLQLSCHFFSFLEYTQISLSLFYFFDVPKFFQFLCVLNVQHLTHYSSSLAASFGAVNLSASHPNLTTIGSLSREENIGNRFQICVHFTSSWSKSFSTDDSVGCVVFLITFWFRTLVGYLSVSNIELNKQKM